MKPREIGIIVLSAIVGAISSTAIIALALDAEPLWLYFIGGIVISGVAATANEPLGDSIIFSCIAMAVLGIFFLIERSILATAIAVTIVVSLSVGKMVSAISYDIIFRDSDP